MKAVILAKSTEMRVPYKNYRPFYGDLSLIDILIGKLIKVIPKEDIYLSCEDLSHKDICEKWGIHFLLRDSIMTSYNVSNVDIIADVMRTVPDDNAYLWATCVEPFFNEYSEIIDIWNSLDKNKYDSLNVVYPMKKFMLDSSHNPIGFGFGHWHKYSQEITPLYQISWATAIMSKKCIETVSYMVGTKPYWYDSYAPIIDIDTEEDFRFVQSAYKAYVEEKTE